MSLKPKDQSVKRIGSLWNTSVEHRLPRAQRQELDGANAKMAGRGFSPGEAEHELGAGLSLFATTGLILVCKRRRARLAPVGAASTLATAHQFTACSKDV